MTKKLICISCPMGCNLSVEQSKNGEILSVSGNQCKRGDVYAQKELTAPTRTITSTVSVVNGDKPLVSVRTKTDIPKEKIWQCMAEIKKATVKAPIAVGDIIIKNIAGTDTDLIATSITAEKE